MNEDPNNLLLWCQALHDPEVPTTDLTVELTHEVAYLSGVVHNYWPPSSLIKVYGEQNVSFFRESRPPKFGKGYFRCVVHVSDEGMIAEMLKDFPKLMHWRADNGLMDSTHALTDDYRYLWSVDDDAESIVCVENNAPLYSKLLTLGAEQADATEFVIPALIADPSEVI